MSEPTTAVNGEDDRSASEVAALRRRVAELEAQLIDTEAWANRAVADAQEKVYWLDRWHVDLNAVMARRGATRMRAVMRGIRSVVRFFKAGRTPAPK